MHSAISRDDLIEFALEHEALTTRELAIKYTDEKRYFISGSSAYRILKAADLITAPDYVVIKAADEFTIKPRPSTRCSSRAYKHALPGKGQTDFTYFKIIHYHGLQANHYRAAGWGWFYLSTIY